MSFWRSVCAVTIVPALSCLTSAVLLFAHTLSLHFVTQDGPLSPGAFQCARECNKMGSGCAAFGVVAGSNCYIMSSVRCICCVCCVCCVSLCLCALRSDSRSISPHSSVCSRVRQRRRACSCSLTGSPVYAYVNQVNASAGGADSLVTAICMKNLKDWMDLGTARGGESQRMR